MQPYEFFDHTADTLFKAHGKNLEEAFANAARALTSLMVDPTQVKEVERRTINVQGYDLKALLYNFLEHFLILVDAEGFIMHDLEHVAIKRGKTFELIASVTGDTVRNYAPEMHIKAITYNDMHIDENEQQATVQVVVDL
ncbi:MAG: archease [archaeon]